MDKCAVCSNHDLMPLASPKGNFSITSNVKIIPGQVSLFFCSSCGHTMTEALPNIATYYSTGYNLLINSAEEDQFYEMKDGKEVYRFDHQANVFLQMLNPSPGSKILDYGSAKGGTYRLLSKVRPDLNTYLFDVSDSYRPFWNEFMESNRTASHHIPEEWMGTFDIVTSFFVLEHVEAPIEMLKQVKKLLKKNGRFYFIVPDALANTSDFIVADHIQHFSSESLRRLFQEAGLSLVELSSTAHRGAFIGVASVAPAKEIGAIDSIADLASKIEQATNYWVDAQARIEEFEKSIDNDAPVAIYGAGFYGAFILNSMSNPNRIGYFVDRDKYKWHRANLGREVLPPDQLPTEIEAVMVGLNPAISRSAIDSLKSWQQRNLQYFYV